MKSLLRRRAAGIVLERKWCQRYGADACKDRDCGCSAESKESAATTSRCSCRCPHSCACGSRCALIHCRSSRALREADIQHTTCGWISLSCRALFSRDLTRRLPFSCQDRASVKNQRLHVSLVIVREHESRVRRDVERTEWTKINRRRLIGPSLDRRTGHDRSTRTGTETIDGDRLVVSGG